MKYWGLGHPGDHMDKRPALYNGRSILGQPLDHSVRLVGHAYTYRSSDSHEMI